MTYLGQISGLDAALVQVEAGILPGLSLALDTMLDAAALARAGHDAESYAAQLRVLALELDSLVRELEAAVPLAASPQRD